MLAKRGPAGAWACIGAATPARWPTGCRRTPWVIHVPDAERMTAFWQSLTAALGRDGWAATGFRVEGDMGLRVVFRCDGQQPQEMHVGVVEAAYFKTWPEQVWQ